MTELSITTMGAQGDGIAPLPEGGHAFIPYTLPGERVEAHLGAPRQGMVPGSALSILSASPERVPAPCIHFGRCGSCALQHWADAPYAAWKRGRLVAALESAGFVAPLVHDLARTPPGARRRADLGLERLADGRVTIGFHTRGSHELIPLAECPVLQPALVALLPPLAETLRSLSALKRLGAVVVNMLDSGPDLLLRTDAPLTMPDRQRLAAFAATHRIPRIAWSTKGANEVAAQHEPVRHHLSGLAITPPAGAFLQASREGEAAIIAAVLAGLPAKLSKRARLLDLYAGIGTLSLPLAAHGVVQAYEGDGAAVTALAGAHPRVTATRRDLARQPLLPAELTPYAAVVLDPPFNGAPEQVAQIARSAVPHVVYVSCNPAALARDGATLRAAGFALREATPVDQFLWSPHLESVAVFTR